MNTELLNINVPNGTKIAVIGDIHAHPEQFFGTIDKISPSKSGTWVVSCGDIVDKGFGLDAENKIIDYFRVASYQGFGFAVRGNHEIKYIKKAKKNGFTEQLRWLRQLPLAICFTFRNGTKVTVLHGGVTPNYTWNDLNFNSELCYVRTINKSGHFIPLIWEIDENGNKVLRAKEKGVKWHDLYDGRFGYIASGHDAQKDGIAKFYKYSVNLDSSCYSTGKLTTQIFTEDGLGDSFVIEGTPSNPDIPNIEN